MKAELIELHGVFDSIERFEDFIEVIGQVVCPDFNGTFFKFGTWERGEREDVLHEVLDIPGEVSGVFFA